MPYNVAAVLAEIDAVLKKYEEVFQKYKKTGASRGTEYISAPNDVAGEIMTLLSQTITRLAPVADYGERARESAKRGMYDDIIVAAGILKALRDDYANGRILTLQERIRSDVFSDFLEMAEWLIEDEGLKDPAAILAGGVLEDHLRSLCVKNGITLPAKPTIDPMNNELVKAGIYGKNDQKQVTAWAAIRNSAAHAKYRDYTPEQVKIMIAWIRNFIGQYPA